MIYKKDIKFINAKIAFNGKYAYKWTQQGGRKGRKNQGVNKNTRKSDGDSMDRTDSDSSCFSQFSQTLGRGRGKQRGSRKRQTTGENHNGGGKDKKIKEHLHDKNYNLDICTDNTAGDGSFNDEALNMRGASGADVLIGGNRIPMSPLPSTHMHPNTPRNLGTIPKTCKDKDFQLFPPSQDPPNRQGISHNLDRYAYKTK